MRTGWEIRRLGDFFDITSSKRVFQAEWRSAGIPFYRAREIVKLAKYGFVENELFISNEMYAAYKAKYGVPSIDDILITGVGTSGVCYLIKDTSPFYFKDGNVIWLHKKRDILSRYVIYAFQTEDVKKQVHKNPGATVGTYTIEGAKNTIIPIPSLPEQLRIVDILDQEFAKIDALKANAEKSLQAAKDLFQATLKKELEPKEGWKVSSMGEVSSIARGGSPRPIKAFITEDANGINWIKIGDTEVGGKYISSTKEKIRKEGMRSSRFVEAGDFLLSNSMSFGRPYILKTNGCIHDGWLVIKKYESTFTQDFLYYLLLSPSVVKQFEEGARGSTVRNLNTDIVSSVRVSYPSSLKEQEEIVAQVEEQNYKCKALQDNYQKTLDLCDDLKQSLLRKAFSGEL